MGKDNNELSTIEVSIQMDGVIQKITNLVVSNSILEKVNKTISRIEADRKANIEKEIKQLYKQIDKDYKLLKDFNLMTFKMKKTEPETQSQSLDFTLQEAIAMYPSASEALKSKLDAAFGKKALITDVLERLKDASIEEFYQEAGRPRITSVSELPEDLHEYILSVYDGIVMYEAVNQGQRLSYLDTTTRKYQAWFNLLSSGSVDFYVSLCHCSLAHAGDASRLSAVSAKAAETLGKNPACQNVFQNIMNK